MLQCVCRCAGLKIDFFIFNATQAGPSEILPLSYTWKWACSDACLFLDQSWPWCVRVCIDLLPIFPTTYWLNFQNKLLEVGHCLDFFLKCQSSCHMSQHRWDGQEVIVHHGNMIAGLLCRLGGGHNAEASEREPIFQPHKPWQSQSQRRSNNTPASTMHFGEVDQFLPVRPLLIDNSSLSSLCEITEANTWISLN